MRKLILALMALLTLNLSFSDALAQSKISALPSASALGGTEQIPVVQGGATKAATVNQIGALSTPAIGGLSAASALAGTETLPVVQGGSTKAATAAQIAALVTTGTIQAAIPDKGRPVRIACIGDSIANYTCLLRNNSWLFWALASVPRRVDFEPIANQEAVGAYPAYQTTGSDFGVAGSSTGTGSCSSAGTQSGSMNCPNKLAALAQYNPDILIVWVGANESTTGSATTVANIQSAVNYVLTNQPTQRLRAVILIPTTPRTANASQGSLTTHTALQMQSAIANRQAALQLERTSTIYHILDLPGVMVDPAQAGYTPIGCCTGATATAVTNDGIHPSNYLAMIAGLGTSSPSNRLLDTLSVDRIIPRALATGDYWDATNAPYGQLISTETGTGGSVTASTNYGIFTTSGGTATGTGAGTAVIPNGWQNANGSSNAELLWSSTINVAVTDQYGRARRAYETVFSSSSALTADRTWNQQYRVAAARLTAGGIYEASIHAKIKAGCKGLTSISLYLSMSDSTAGHPFITESAGLQATPYASHDWTADLIDPFVATADLDLDITVPTYTIPTSATTNIMFFQPQTSFLSGSLGTGNTCTIDWSDAQMHRIG